MLLVVAGLRVSRVAPLVCPACIALLGPSIQKAWGDLARLTAPTPAAAMVLFLPTALTFSAAQIPVQRALTCLPIDDAWAPDRTAAAQLRGHTGRLWTAFDWGEYAIWQFGAGLRVSIDGRRETVYCMRRHRLASGCRAWGPGRDRTRDRAPRGVRVAAVVSDGDAKRARGGRLSSRRRYGCLVRGGAAGPTRAGA